MKVTVCCGELRVVVPCDDGTIDINELTTRAATRIGNILSKSSQSISSENFVISFLKTEQNAILYGGDTAKDVLDNHDMVNAVFLDNDKLVTNGGSFTKAITGFNHVTQTTLPNPSQNDQLSPMKTGHLAKVPFHFAHSNAPAITQHSPDKNYAAGVINSNQDPNSHTHTSKGTSAHPVTPTNVPTNIATRTSTADGTFQYNCIQCAMSFSQQEALAEHITTHVNEMRRSKGPKEAQCPLCQKILKNPDNLKKHMYIHSDKRPFQCEHCTKRFRSKSDMRVHIRIHTGEKPYHCAVPDCGKSFNDRSSFRRHGMSHRGVKRVRNKQIPESSPTSTLSVANVIQLTGISANSTPTTTALPEYETAVLQPSSSVVNYTPVVHASETEMQSTPTPS